MFKLFKTKKEKQEDKQKSLKKELEDFTEKYQKYFNCYAFTGKDIFIYHEPKILDNELVITLTKVDTPEGYVNNIPIWFFNLKYGENFLKEHKNNFIKLKDQMEKLGLSVTKIKEN